MESNEFRRPNRLWEVSLSCGEAEIDVRPQTRVLNWARFRWSLHLLGNVGVIGYGGRYGLQEVVSRVFTFFAIYSLMREFLIANTSNMRGTARLPPTAVRLTVFDVSFTSQSSRATLGVR